MTTIPDTTTVETSNGTVTGLVDGGVARFTGIPYAVDPAGTNRFAAPVPVMQRVDIDATESVPAPVDVRSGADRRGDRSQLFVNVTAPAEIDESELAPVLFYIHGGGFREGTPNDPVTDGGRFATEGVVVVRPSYRLGFDGFGWLPDAPRNRALLDLQLALRWTAANIERFGGDPSRITVAGHSAGAILTYALLASPGTDVAVQGAWALSGRVRGVEESDAAWFTDELSRYLGRATTARDFADVPEDVLAAAEEQLVDPGQDMERVRTLSRSDMPLGPIVNTDALPTDMVEGIGSGRGGSVPLVLGSTDDEFTAAGTDVPDDGTDARDRLIAAGMNPNDVDEYISARPDASVGALLGAWVTDARYHARFAPVLDQRAGAAAAGTWAYRFGLRSASSGLVGHGDDVPYFFAETMDGERDTRHAMHEEALRFIRTGRPGWSRYGSTRLTYRFDDRPQLVSDAYASSRSLSVAPWS